MTYSVIFWGNSPHSIKIFKIQKKIIRITTNLRDTDSCRNIYKTMKILLFYSHYIFPLLIHIDNIHLFITIQEIHYINTKSNIKFHIPSSNLTKSQKGVHVYYSGNKLFSHLPPHIRSYLLIQNSSEQF